MEKKQNILEAVRILKQGGIVIFPTDTAFGIGCRADNEVSIQKLFKIRQRPETQPVSVLVDTVTMAKKYVTSISQDVIDKLIEPYWPGALTIILENRKDSVFPLIQGGGKTVGVRIPNHSIARKLIRGTGVGILGPSANFHGDKTPYSMDDLNPELVKLVDYVVPGECHVKEASTVIDCTVTPWKIVRQGAIKIQKSKIKNQKINSKLKNREKIIILIDTSDNQKIQVGIKAGKNEDIISQKITLQKAQVVLPLIDRLLKKHSLRLNDINLIEVNSGPGSFTGLRVGIAIANALSFAIQIPVNKKPIGEFVEPAYR